MSVNPQNALTLAWWVRTMMPTVYAVMVQKAAQATTRKTITGLGQCLCLDLACLTTCVSGSTAGSCSYASVFDAGTCAAVSAGSCNVASDFTLTSADPVTLEPVTLDTSDLPEPTLPADGSTAAASSSTSDLSSVGSYLTSSAGLSALASVTTAVLKAQTAASDAETAQAVLASQVATVKAGNSPAAVSYTVNPTTGALTPVLATTSGTLPLTSSLLAAATPGVSSSTLQVESFLSQYGLYLAAGLLGLYILLKKR
jgi:hypothetical protein